MRLFFLGPMTLVCMLGACTNAPVANKQEASKAQIVKRLRVEPEGCRDLGLVRSAAQGSVARGELEDLVAARGGNTMVVHKKMPGTVSLPMDSKAAGTIAHAYACE